MQISFPFFRKILLNPCIDPSYRFIIFKEYYDVATREFYTTAQKRFDTGWHFGTGTRERLLLAPDRSADQ